MTNENVDDISEIKFLSSPRIIRLTLTIFLTIFVGYIYYPFEQHYFTHTHIYIALGFLVSVFGVLKCISLLIMHQSKESEHVGFAIFIYLLIFIIGNASCNGIKKYGKPVRDRAKQERYERAYQKELEHVNNQVALKPDNDTSYLQRGEFYRRHSSYEKAMQDFDAALNINPQNHMALFRKGNYYAARKDYEKALEMYERADTSSKGMKSRIIGIKKQIKAAKNEQNE